VSESNSPSQCVVCCVLSLADQLDVLRAAAEEIRCLRGGSAALVRRASTGGSHNTRLHDQDILTDSDDDEAMQTAHQSAASAASAAAAAAAAIATDANRRAAGFPGLLNTSSPMYMSSGGLL
jgi:hypothetical protein